MQSRIIAMCEELTQLRKARQRQALSNGCLHVGQPGMLEFIRNHPGCSQKQMADEARVTPASVSASFKRLEAARLIMRRTDTADTRCNRVYITEAGERELNDCQAEMKRIDCDMLCGIDAQELDIFEKCLAKMLFNLHQDGCL